MPAGYFTPRRVGDALSVGLKLLRQAGRGRDAHVRRANSLVFSGAPFSDSSCKRRQNFRARSSGHIWFVSHDDLAVCVCRGPANGFVIEWREPTQVRFTAVVRPKTSSPIHL
jgi:hypothetical protein